MILHFVLFAVWGQFIFLNPHHAIAVDNQETPKTVLFLGDSLTAGLGLDPSEAYPSLIEQKLKAAGMPFRVINAGVSGDTSADGLRRLDWILRGRVDVAVIALGANDGLRGLPVDECERNLLAVVDKIREKNPAVKIVVAGMLIPPNMGASYMREFRDMFPRVAEKRQAVLIPFLLKGVAGISSLNLGDGIHPTAEGQKIMAETAWKVLEPILRTTQQASQ